MDYQRVAILFGLAVTSYLLVLAWNEDYGSSSKDNNALEVVNKNSQESLIETPSLSTLGDEDLIPSITTQDSIIESTEKDKEFSSPFITISTDVFDLKIALNGGDIISVALREYPQDLDDPENPFVLVDPRNSYAAQTGLIGQNGTDKNGVRPTFRSSKTDYTIGMADELVVELFHYKYHHLQCIYLFLN